MSSLTKVNDNWIPLQTKVFSRWVSSHLRHPDDAKVADITKDLSNGVALVELASQLTQKQPPRQWCESPKRNVDMVQNCDLAIDMFTKDGVKLVGISGKDINDNNQKLILGLIWTLIIYYSIGKSVNQANSIKTNVRENVNDNIERPRHIPEKDDHVKEELYSWAIERTSNYPNIHNFAPVNLSLCALLDSYFPEKINYYTLNPNDSRHISKLAIDVMDEVGIPVYVFPEELERYNYVIDEKTLLTQLAAAKVILDQQHTREVSTSHQRGGIFDEKQDFDSDSCSENEVERLSKALEETRAELEAQKAVNVQSCEEKMKLSNALANAEAEIINQKKTNQKNEEEINRLSVQFKESQKNLVTENKLLHEALSDKEMELRSEKWEKSKVESEVNELSQTINEMKQKVDSHEEDKKRANAEVEKLLKAASDDAANSRLELEKELKAANEAKEKAESQLFAMTKQINNYKNEKELFAKSLKDIQEEKDEAEKEVARLTKLTQSSTSSTSSTRDVDMQNQKLLENELNEARAAKEKLENQISALSKQIDDFKVEKELFAKSLKDIQDEKEAAEREVARLTKLSRSSPVVGGDVESKRRLQNKLQLAEAGKERAVAELFELSSKIEDYENQKELLANTLRYVQEEKESAESEVARLSRAVVEAEARNALLERTLEDAQNEVEAHKESSDFHQTNVNNISRAYDELQETMDAKIQDLQGELEWITAEKSEVEADAAVLAKALREEGADKEKAEEEVGRLSRAVVEAEARIALLEREIVVQKEASESLQQTIAKLTQDYDSLKENYYWTNEQKEEAEEDASVLANSLIKREKQVIQLLDNNYEARKYAAALTKALSRAKNEIGEEEYEQIEDLFDQNPENRNNDNNNNDQVPPDHSDLQKSRELAQMYSNALDEALIQLHRKSEENKKAQNEIRNLASELGEADYEVQRLTKAWQHAKGQLKQQNEQIGSSSDVADQLEAERRARIEAEQQVVKLNAELDQANDDIDMLNESLADTEIERDSLKKLLKKSNRRNRSEKIAAREAELQAENLAYNLAMRQASDAAKNNNNSNANNQKQIANLATRNLANNLETKLQHENDRNININEGREFDSEAAREAAQSDFEGLPVEENNFRLSGRKFGLTMTIDNKKYALTMVDTGDHFLNEGGLKLDLAEPNIEKDPNQQFTFGKDAWNTVIDSFARKGMVWDVANAETWNPPNGTAFYLYPFHGRHNQHFVFKDDGMIYAKQNGQVVTYVGGSDVPFVMSEPNPDMKDKQTFELVLL